MDAGFKGAPWGSYTTAELKARRDRLEEVEAGNANAAKMTAELERRALRDAGDRSVMTDGEKLHTPVGKVRSA
jgi:hypothetical protein